MTKFGYYKCETCGQEVCKKKQKLHKCVKADPNRLVDCSICKKGVNQKNFSAHFKVCQAREFCAIFMPFFVFFARMISYHNRGIKQTNIPGLGSRAEREKYIQRTFGSRGTKGYQIVLNGVIKEKLNEAEDKLKEAAIESGVDPKKIKNKEAVLDALRFTARLSARQIIFDFLEKKEIKNEKIMMRLEKKFKKRDYPTDKEISTNPKLFDEIKTIRANSGYTERYEKFYFLLEQYYSNRDLYKCKYCNGFSLKMKKHVNKCESFRDYFYGHTEEAIESYLNSFYGAGDWLDYQVRYYIDYYKKYSVNYFIETIEKHINDKISFREKIEQGKRELMKQQKTKFSAQDLIKEVDAWKPTIKMNEKMDDEKSAKSEDFGSFFPDFSEDDEDEEMESQDCESESIASKVEKTSNEFFNFSQIGRFRCLDAIPKFIVQYKK